MRLSQIMNLSPANRFYVAALVVAIGSYVLVWQLFPQHWKFLEAQSTADNSQRPWRDAAQGHRHSDESSANSVELKSESNEPARDNERVLRFKDAAALAAFLSKADEFGVRILGQIEALHTLRIGILDEARWRQSEANSQAESAPNFLVNVPELPEGSVQDGAIGFGANLLAWLGVDSDNSSWGKGVKLAVLDTGVAEHPGMENPLRQISLLEKPMKADKNGHGTAVASLIAGKDAAAPGVAPATSLLSIQVADENGISDSFLVAQGIVQAVENGAKIINISLGSHADSRVLRDAVAYAAAEGAVIVAAAGNNGMDGVAYPAAYEGVVAVGSVDARGEHLDFSNKGWNLDVTAPGYALDVAWPGEKIANFTGTSASTPIVAGAIAATMSQYELSATKAAELVVAHLNDAGSPGLDASYGSGMLDVGRVMRKNIPGQIDLAVAAQSLSILNGAGRVEVVLQNRGTESVHNPVLTVNAAGQTVKVSAGNLRPGEISVEKVSVGKASEFKRAGTVVESRVELPEGKSDINAANNSRRATVSKE